MKIGFLFEFVLQVAMGCHNDRIFHSYCNSINNSVSLLSYFECLLLLEMESSNNNSMNWFFRRGKCDQLIAHWDTYINLFSVFVCTFLLLASFPKNKSFHQKLFRVPTYFFPLSSILIFSTFSYDISRMKLFSIRTNFTFHVSRGTYCTVLSLQKGEFTSLQLF